MKHHGSIMDFTRRRNDDIMRVYRQQIQSASHIVMPDIFRRVADSPSCRFWVSEERAAIEISRILAGKHAPPMRQNRREMFDEILRRFLILQQKFPDKPFRELISMTINQPAPKFYLTARTIGEIYYRIKKGHYDY